MVESMGRHLPPGGYDYQAQKRHDDCRRRRDGFMSLVGRRYAEATLANFQVYDPKQEAALKALRDYAADAEANVRRGRGVLLFGPPGTGKDHLLVGLARATGWAVRVGWVNGLDFYGEVRDRMDSDRPEAELVRSLVSPDVLVISDPLPPWGQLSQFQAATFFRVIDGRYRDCRPTWVSMNVAHGDEASSRLGAAVVDRLREGALSVYCDWPSYRTRKES